MVRRHDYRGALEQSQLAVVGVVRFVTLCADQAMGRSKELDMLSVPLDGSCKLGRGEELVEGIADVFEFSVEFIAVAIEPVLQAF